MSHNETPHIITHCLPSLVTTSFKQAKKEYHSVHDVPDEANMHIWYVSFSSLSPSFCIFPSLATPLSLYIYIYYIWDIPNKAWSFYFTTLCHSNLAFWLPFPGLIPSCEKEVGNGVLSRERSEIGQLSHFFLLCLSTASSKLFVYWSHILIWQVAR